MLALERRGTRRALIRPRISKVHVEGRTADGDNLLGLAEVVVANVDAITSRRGHCVVHLVRAVVVVDEAHRTLGRLGVLIVGDLNDELIVTRGTLRVAGVLGTDEERNLNSKDTLHVCVDTGTVRDAVLGGGVRKVPELQLVHSPALVVDVDPQIDLEGAEVLEVGRLASESVLVDKVTRRNLLVLATPEGHFDLVRFLELQTMDDNLGFAKHGANVRNNLGASIRRADDGRDVQGPRIAEPAVAPSSEQNHLAGLRIVSHRGILAHHRRATDRLRRVPNQGAAVHHVNVVHVLVLPFLSGEAEHLVLWH